MAKYDWVINRPRVCAVPLVKITPTNTYRFNLHDYIIITSDWSLDLLQLNAHWFG
jgi:hypothetical protein